jgi:protoporphyrinogen oxidase
VGCLLLAAPPTRSATDHLGLCARGCGGAEYEESVEQFIRRNLGAEVFERLIEPFCSGVYAGNPAKLGMQAAFGRVSGPQQGLQGRVKANAGK